MQSFWLVFVLSLMVGFVVSWGVAGLSRETPVQVVSGERR